MLYRTKDLASYKKNRIRIENNTLGQELFQRRVLLVVVLKIKAITVMKTILNTSQER